MHGMHARLPKGFVLEERLERYADIIEVCPRHLRGDWARACHPLPFGDPAASAVDLPRYREVRLDLGCGKGAFVIESARREPDVLFVGVDGEPYCIARAAQYATEAGVRNAVFAPGVGMAVTSFFAPGELARIHLNFSTPYPRKRDAARRLTSVEHLMAYRDVLAPGGTVSFRTDSLPFREFTLTQLALAGYEVTWRSDDARAERPEAPVTEYEERLCAQGATVYAIDAVPGPRPESWEQTASLSLVDYLPSDLEGMGYVPYGMEASVRNLRNLERKGRSRGEAR